MLTNHDTFTKVAAIRFGKCRAAADSSEARFFQTLMEMQIRIELEDGGAVTRNIGELVRAIGTMTEGAVPTPLAHDHLRRCGFVVDDGYTGMSNTR